jgi:arabinan endo-1,5-alpha-L-arabinosidase
VGVRVTPNLVQRDGWWYLFSSWGYCCQSLPPGINEYQVRVVRSRDITGPYVDAAGVPAMQGGGTLVLASAGAMEGPGHSSVLHDGSDWWIAHHYYDRNNNRQNQGAIRRLGWTPSGWPLIVPVDAGS